MYMNMCTCTCIWVCKPLCSFQIFEDHTGFPGCCPLLPDWDLPGYTGLMACLTASVSFTEPSACLASYALEFYISLLQVF